MNKKSLFIFLFCLSFLSIKGAGTSSPPPGGEPPVFIGAPGAVIAQIIIPGGGPVQVNPIQVGNTVVPGGGPF